MREALVSLVVAASALSAAAFTLDEDFTTVSPDGGSPSIEIHRTSILSHSHGAVRDDGYAVLLKGNQHYVAMPPARDFSLKCRYRLVNHDVDEFGLGYRVLFRADRATGRRHELLVWWSNVSTNYASHTLKFFLDGREFHSAARPKLPGLEEMMDFALDVKGSRLSFETFGERGETDIADNGAPDLGKIAFDLPYSGGNMLVLRHLSLVTADEPAFTPLKQYSFELRGVEGAVVPPRYTVKIGRWATGETKVDLVFDGTVNARPKRDETGGGEWTLITERFTTPYVRFGTDLVYKFWDGMKQFADPEMLRRKKPLNGSKVEIPEWPVRRTFVTSNFPDDFGTIAAGYEYAVCGAFRFCETGPWEQVRDAEGRLLWEGEAIGRGKIAFAAVSPAKKAIMDRIPKDVPEYERCMTHARNQHHFLESEKVRFTLAAIFRGAEFEPGEIAFAPRFENVFAEPLGEKGAFTLGEAKTERLEGGLAKVTREITLDSRLPVGVYRLVCGVGMGSDRRDERVEFEVLSDRQGGTPPPLASGLPFLFSMPNETKYKEECAFDPFCDRSGPGLYYTAEIYYPVPGMRKHVADVLHAYDRKWFAQTHARNSGDRDCRSEANKAVLRVADFVPMYDNDLQPERVDLTNQGFYYGRQMKYLIDYAKTRKPPFKVIRVEDLEKRLAEGKRGISDEEFLDLFNTCWSDFVDYARAETEKADAGFNRYLLSVNPNIARAEYGPMAIYTATYKTSYWLRLASAALNEDADELNRNGSFWVFEEYHHSCDYPLYRGALFAASYAMNFPNSRKLYPEIYYSGWGRCNDGAVFQAHPGRFRVVLPAHQRRIAYQYAYGTPFFRRGKRDSTFDYWRDYGFHASCPGRADIDEFVAAWKNVKNFQPKDPLKAPFVVVDHDAFKSYGDYLETESSFQIEIGDQKYGSAGDVCNLAEEAMAFSYEKLVAAGWNNPVVTSMKELPEIDAGLAEFVVLPPISKNVKSAPNFRAAIRKMHERGVPLLIYGECDGLEDVFGVRRLKEPKPLRELRGDHFSHKLALQRYEPTSAKALDPVLFVRDDGKGRTAFVNVPPTTVNRHTFRERYTRGQPVVGDAIFATLRLAADYLTKGDPAVKTEYGNIMAFTAKAAKGLGVAICDDAPIYGKRPVYPVSFRFTVSYKGVGRGVVECEDAPFEVVERSDDRVVVRTEVKDDSAVFFNFRPPHMSTYLAEEELRTYWKKATGGDVPFKTAIGTLDTMPDVPAAVRERLSKLGPRDSYYSAFKDGVLWIVGKESLGEVYGVYHFLEEKLGVRWFKAPIEGDDGEYIPDGLAGFVPAEYEHYRAPDYYDRSLSATGVYQDRIPEKGMTTAMRNGFQINPMYTIDMDSRLCIHNRRFWDYFRPRCSRRQASAGGGHELFSQPMIWRFGSRQAAFDKHPEYFALVGGKRVLRKYPQYCLSNPDFRRICVEYYLENFRRLAGMGTLYFCAEDVPDGWCECEECLKLDGSTDNRGRPLLEVSTRMGKMCKYLSDEIYKAYPEAHLVYMPYSNFRNKPEGVDFDKRVFAQYCIGSRCWAHELDDPKCDRNVNRLRLFRELSEMGLKMQTYEYKTCSHLMYGGPTAATEVHDLRYMHDVLHSVGWHNEASFSDSHWIPYGGNTNFYHNAQRFPSNWFWLNAAGHALWDCHMDLDAFTRDRESKYYGAAYPAMKKYQDYRRELWAANSNHMGYPFGDARTPTVLLVEGSKEKLLAWLDEAEKLVQDDPKRLSRVRLDRRWLTDYWIKPADKIRERMKNPVIVADVARGIKVDGVDDEASWSKACFIDNFLVTTVTSGGKKDELGKKAPDVIAMTAKVMRDAEAFYFFVDLANPENYEADGYRFSKDRDGHVWGDSEAVEIFLYPPTDENKYYHIAVNAIGTVFDAKHTPVDVKYDIDISAATKPRKGGGCTMEIRVPVTRFANFVPGENWRMNIVRDLKMKNPVLSRYNFQALGGVSHNDTSNYWPAEIK